MSTENDDGRIDAAFDRLRRDSESVDTMAALRAHETGTGPRWSRAGALAAVTALIVVVIAVAVWRGTSDEPSVDLASGDVAQPDTAQPDTAQPDTAQPDTAQPDTAQPDTGGSETTVVGSELDATSWLLTSGTGPDGEVPIVDEWPITLSFTADTLGGTAACNSFGGNYRLDGATLNVDELARTEMACVGDGGSDNEGVAVMQSEARFMAALRAVDRLVIEGSELTLTGPSSELRFSLGAPVPATEPEPSPSPADTVDDEPISVNELLEGQRRGPVLVEAHLLYRGGSWILCDTIDVENTPRCTGRWVVVNNYDAVVDPHTEPPTSIADAAFGLAGVNPEFVAEDDAVYTPRAQLLVIVLLDDGRAVVPEWPSGTELAEPESELIDAFIRFATGVSADTEPLMPADTVALGLGDEIIVTRTADELADPDAWQLDAEAFRARVGPFSALDLLADAGQGNKLAGRHDHCAAPPTPIPAELQDARQLSVQPTGIDSCLAWWTVDLFVDADGRVVAIIVDLWEP